MLYKSIIESRVSDIFTVRKQAADEEWENIASNAMIHDYALYEFLTGTEN